MKYLLTILMAITLSAICNKLSAQEKSIEVSMDIEMKNGEEQRNFVVTIGDGSNEKEIKWSDNGTLPMEVKTQLEKEGVNISMLEGDGEVEVTVNADGTEDVEKEIEVIKIITDGDGEHSHDNELEIDSPENVMVFEIDGDEELPAELKQILEEHEIDLDELVDEALHEADDHDAKIIKKKAIRIQTIDDKGDESLMEWNGNGEEIPEEVKELLEKEGIDLNGGEQKMIFIGKDSDVEEIKITKDIKKQFKIKTIDENGSEKIIQWDGEGEMPAEMKAHEKHFKKEKKVIKKSSGNRAQLGVMIEDNEDGKGVKVIDVVDNSPAAAVGIAKGYIITAIDDKKVNSIEALLDAIKPHAPGDNINIKFIENEQEKNVDVTLADLSEKSNVFIFQNAVAGEDFDILKDVEQCEEGTTTKKIVIKIDKREGTDELVKDLDKIDTDVPAERKLDLQEFAAFPNPTSGTVNIKFTAEQRPLVVQVTDITGKEVFKESLNNFNGSYSKDLDLSNYPKGQFIVYVIQDEKIFTESIILQ